MSARNLRTKSSALVLAVLTLCVIVSGDRVDATLVDVFSCLLNGAHCFIPSNAGSDRADVCQPAKDKRMYGHNFVVVAIDGLLDMLAVVAIVCVHGSM